MKSAKLVPCGLRALVMHHVLHRVACCVRYWSEAEIRGIMTAACTSDTVVSGLCK